MSDKISLTNLVNLQNETTAVNAINANNAILTTALDNTISRDGTSPNTMGAALDMNNQAILNLPNPTTFNSPLRLADLNSFTGGTLVVSPLPSGGTKGQVLTKNSSTNYDTSWQGVASTADIQNVINNGGLYAKLSNSITLTSTLTLPNNFTLDLSGYDVTQGFSGDMFNMDDSSKIMNGHIIGVPETYSGRGIYISQGAFQRLLNVDIFNTLGYNLDFAPNCGTGFIWSCGSYYKSDFTEAINLPSSELATSGIRQFFNLGGGGTSMINLAGGHFTIIEACDGIQISFTTNSTYALIHNCRFASAPTVYGTFHQLHGCIFDGSVTLGAGAQNCVVEAQPGLPVIDNSGNTTNTIIPAAGDHTLYGNWKVSASGTPFVVNSTNNATLIGLADSGVIHGLIGSNANIPIFVENSLGQVTHEFVDDTTGAGTVANYPTIHAVATGNAVNYAATGSDTNVDLALTPQALGLIKLGNVNSVTANGAVATTMTSLGPTGSHTTIQEWLTIKNPSGTTRYIPCY